MAAPEEQNHAGEGTDERKEKEAKVDVDILQD